MPTPSRLISSGLPAIPADGPDITFTSPTIPVGYEDLRALVDLADTSELSSIRQTVLQILQIVDDPLSSADDLTNIISTDPPLSARLLRLANSAHFGLSRRIGSIHDAVVCIGFDAVKEVALTQKVCEIFAEDDEGFGYSRFALWQHSVAVALCARELCRQVGRGPRPETAYAAGLLHDIGILVIDQFLQFDFLVILRDASEENLDLMDVEEMVLGFSHADVGQALTQTWKFPKEFSRAIGLHHAPTQAQERDVPLSTVLCLADLLVYKTQTGFSDIRRPNPKLLAHCMRALQLTEANLKPVVARLQEDLRRIRQLGWYRGQSPS